MELTSKPESDLCLLIRIIAITCQLFFEFSLWVLNFTRIHFHSSLILRSFYNRKKHEINDPQN